MNKLTTSLTLVYWIIGLIVLCWAASVVSMLLCILLCMFCIPVFVLMAMNCIGALRK